VYEDHLASGTPVAKFIAIAKANIRNIFVRNCYIDALFLDRGRACDELLH
jgi:hypothetical protein